MDPERLSTLLSLDPEDRYWHTVDRVAETGILWRLDSPEGVFTDIAPEGFDYLPLWPDRALAQLAADLLYPGKTPAELPLDDFRAEWVDYLEEKAVRLGIFPDADGAFWDVSPLEFHDAVDDAIQTRI